MEKTLKLTTMVFMSALIFSSGEVYAKNDKHWNNGKGHGKSEDHGNKGKWKDDDHDHHSYDRFDNDRRRIIESYLQSHYPVHNYNRNCPPGLAKKNPACMPPGQYKKYVIGQPLPGDVRWRKLPSGLIGVLPAAPNGTYYGMVDNDVLLMSTLTQVVLDAVSR